MTNTDLLIGYQLCVGLFSKAVGNCFKFGFNILLLVSDTLYSVWREEVLLETGRIIFGFGLKNLKDLNF